LGLVIDTEEPERADGERPNRQIRIIGNAELHPDVDAAWTKRIWAKYHSGRPDPDAVAQRLDGRDRTHILIKPHRISAFASISHTLPATPPEQGQPTRHSGIGIHHLRPGLVQSAQSLP
jgi:hypothetical protein